MFTNRIYSFFCKQRKLYQNKTWMSHDAKSWFLMQIASAGLMLFFSHHVGKKTDIAFEGQRE